MNALSIRALIVATAVLNNIARDTAEPDLIVDPDVEAIIANDHIDNEHIPNDDDNRRQEGHRINTRRELIQTRFDNAV